MSLPRRVLPHQTHFVSRRCMQRKLLLTPCRKINHLVRYLLGVYSGRHGVRVVGVIVSTTHWHGVLEDPDGRLPEFMRDVDQTLARCLNAHYGRGENFWAPGSYSSVELDTPEEVVDKLCYLWANAVRDGLVERPEEWPGFVTLPENLGTALLPVARPEFAFFGGRRPRDYEPTYETRARRLERVRNPRRRKRDPQPARAAHRERPSSMPESSVLEIALPSCFLDRDPPGEVRAVLREALEERLEEIYAERREAGLTAYMGADRVREQDPRASAGDVFPDFSLDPVLAGKVTEDRIEKIRTLQAWRGAYAIALEGWRGRKRRVVFPLGTYRMRVLHGVRVEQPAAPT